MHSACGTLLCWALPCIASAATLHVWTNSPANGPGTGWSNAFHTLQEAIDAASTNDTILVTNGTYISGGRLAAGSAVTNRVYIDKPIIVSSVNGSSTAIICGSGGNGPNAVRCAYLTEGAQLAGFTLTNGHTATSGDDGFDRGGGGVFCDGGGTVVNCDITGNRSSLRGGGAYFRGGGTLHDCVIRDSRGAIHGGGVYCDNGGVLQSCTIRDNLAERGTNPGTERGGGVYIAGNGTLIKCLIADNSATDGGGSGGVRCEGGGTLQNCLIIGNFAEWVMGVYSEGAELNNCTVSGNTGYGGGGVYGDADTLIRNCIVFHNYTSGAHRHTNIAGAVTVEYTCSPGLTGADNITNAPLFINRGGGDYRLMHGSPCIDTGTNMAHLYQTDLDGSGRPIDGDYSGTTEFDMGAYEYDAALSDSDQDGVVDSHEVYADTNPTNSASLFRVTAITRHGQVEVEFTSSSNRSYSLSSSTNHPFCSWSDIPDQSHIAATSSLTRLTDSNMTARTVYRVEVHKP